MSVVLERLDPADQVDRADLIAFLTANTFPFHVRPRPTRAQVESSIAAGAYQDDDHESFWLMHDRRGRIGLLRLEDLTDNAPLFDLRLAEQWRGKGLGAEAVEAATDFVFTTLPDVSRFEAQTREDNVAMRRTLRRCGWVK